MECLSLYVDLIFKLFITSNLVQNLALKYLGPNCCPKMPHSDAMEDLSVQLTSATTSLPSLDPLQRQKLFSQTFEILNLKFFLPPPSPSPSPSPSPLPTPSIYSSILQLFLLGISDVWSDNRKSVARASAAFLTTPIFFDPSLVKMYIQHLISTFLSSTDWKTSEGVLVALTSLATRFAPVPVPILDDKKINFSVGGSAMLFVPSLPVPLSIPLLLSAFTHSQAKVRESASLFLTSMLRRISNSPPAVVDLATESLQALLNLKNNDNNNNSNHHQADGLLSCLVVLLHSSHAEFLFDCDLNFMFAGLSALQSSASTVRHFVPSLPVPLSIPLLLSAFTHSQAKVRESASLFLTSMLRRISNSPPAVVDLATESLQALLNLKNNDNNNNSNHHQADGLLSCLVVLLHSSHAEFLFDCDLNFMFAGLSALQSSASTVRQGGAEVLTALASKDAERTATTFARLAACWRPQTDSDSSDWHLQEGILISYEAMLNEVTSCHLFDSNSNSAHTHTILPELVTEKNKNKFDLDVITSHISTSLGSSTFELRRISLMATKSLAKIFCWFDVGRFSISSPSELEIFKAGILHSQHVLEEMEMKMEMVPRHHPWGSSHSGIADCDAARNVNLSVKRCASEFKPECENMIESMKRHCVSRWLPELENLEMLILVQAFCGVFVQRTTGERAKRSERALRKTSFTHY